MRTPAILLALLSTTVVLAGCSDETTPKLETDFQDIELEATPETGVLRGVVFDPSITPIAGAMVTAAGPDGVSASATTNEAGLFGMDGLAPGSWFVRAEKAGYITAQQGAEVVANVAEPEVIKILLEADPSSAPYIQSLVFAGFIECSFSIVLVRIAACSGVGNDAFLEEYTLDQPPGWLQSEMVWDSTQALGNEMQLSITDFSTPLQIRVNASAGISPQYITVNETTARDFRFGINNTVVLRVFNDAVDETDQWPDDEAQAAWTSTVWPVYNSTVPVEVKEQLFFLDECIKYPALFDACLGLGGVGATLQQEYTIYTHVFYQFQPNPGWRFTADGEHPLPQ